VPSGIAALVIATSPLWMVINRSGLTRDKEAESARHPGSTGRVYRDFYSDWTSAVFGGEQWFASCWDFCASLLIPFVGGGYDLCA
ncbi:MAG: hypothetical protein WBF05_03800, partial [Anaerolineales bacterium]